MMYPRLVMARHLLRDDGVIFISIDDHEVHNLRHLGEEVFGPENFVANVVWQKKYTRANDARWFSDNHDHILVFAKNKEILELNLLPRTAEQEKSYSNPDNHPKGPWKATPLHAKSGKNRKSYTFRNGVVWEPPPGTFRRYSDETMKVLEHDDAIWFGADGTATPSRKTFLSETRAGVTPVTIWTYDEVGHNHEANDEIKSLFGRPVFSNPKPIRLVQRMLELATAPDEGHIVLDFFAGSGTTGEAVLAQNAKDGGNRRFILVQLPEPVVDDDYENIAQITRERIMRAAERMRKREDGQSSLRTDDSAGCGFRAFKLTSSNFKLWNAEEAPKDGDQLAHQLALYAEHLVAGRSHQDILFELLLKAGLPLASRIQEHAFNGHKAFQVGDTLICLADRLSKETIDALIARNPTRVICLDHAFEGNDQLKVNTVLEMRAHGVEFRTY